MDSCRYGDNLEMHFATLAALKDAASRKRYAFKAGGDLTMRGGNDRDGMGAWKEKGEEKKGPDRGGNRGSRGPGTSVQCYLCSRKTLKHASISARLCLLRHTLLS